MLNYKAKITKLFHKLSYAKMREGTLVGADMLNLMGDANLSKPLMPDEAAAWSLIDKNRQ